MIVLVGEGTGPKWDAKLKGLGWGRMFVERRPTPYEGEPWGWDNGAFIAWRAGKHLDEANLRRRLDRDIAVGDPYLAVCPDLPAEGQASLDYSLSWIDRLPCDWPWYLAVQDGMSEPAVAEALPQFAGLFLGGTSAFKATAPRWLKIAHDGDRLFHYGRAGTLGKLEHALEIGADSCDSAFPMWTRTRWRTFVEHWQHQPQGRLFVLAGPGGRPR